MGSDDQRPDRRGRDGRGAAVYGDKDKNIPPQALGFMAERAQSKQTVVVKGASHVVMVSHPREVAELIEKAATAASP